MIRSAEVRGSKTSVRRWLIETPGFERWQVALGSPSRISREPGRQPSGIAQGVYRCACPDENRTQRVDRRGSYDYSCGISPPWNNFLGDGFNKGRIGVTEKQYMVCIWVDADACPSEVKNVIFKTARRMQIEVMLVANQPMHIPRSELIHLMTVTQGANVADDKIVEMMHAGDIVVTSDIPLAARVVEKSGVAIGHRGEVFDHNTVHSRLASRNMMEELRAAGMQTGGPQPFSQKDVQQFANALDRTLTQWFRDNEGQGNSKAVDPYVS